MEFVDQTQTALNIKQVCLQKTSLVRAGQNTINFIQSSLPKVDKWIQGQVTPCGPEIAAGSWMQVEGEAVAAGLPSFYLMARGALKLAIQHNY